MNESKLKKEKIQEEQYRLPYHYIPRFEDGVFTQFMNLNWGFEYLSVLEFLLDRLGKIPFQSLVDVGCGDGRFLSEVCKRYADKRLIGIDMSKKALALARAINPSINFFEGDVKSPVFIRKYSLSERFDVVTLIEVLEHISPSECDNFIKGLAGLLKRGGKMILTVPTLNTPLQKKHYRHFDFKTLESLISPYFKVEEIVYLNRLSFISSVIRKLLSNRLFILSSELLRKILYRIYIKTYLYGNAGNAKRLILICKQAG